MPNSLVARASTTVDAPIARTFKALLDPKAIKEYMFGAAVSTDWQEGSPITWKGEFNGKPYEDKGRILEMRAPRRLKYTHFSALSGKPDVAENYHNVAIDLHEHDGRTDVLLTQDRNPTEEARQESQKNWETILTGLKRQVEGRN